MEEITPPSLFERIMATLPGWMLLFGGAAMVAMITLVPPWLECRRLDWQSQVMALQAKQLTSQQVAYEQFLHALREDDPVVVERMAYYHLRLKPVGTTTIDELNQLDTQQAAVYHQVAGAMNRQVGNLPQANVAVQNRIWNTLPTIEDLLAKPIYRPSQYCPAGVVPDTRMVRLVTGPARHLLLGFGVLCLFFGLLPASAATASTIEEMDELDEMDDTAEAFDGDTDADAGSMDHEYSQYFPDATQTAWALAGTGAVSVSAAAGMANELLDEEDEDQAVILAELENPMDDHAPSTLAIGELIDEDSSQTKAVESDLVQSELDEDESDDEDEDDDDVEYEDEELQDDDEEDEIDDTEDDQEYEDDDDGDDEEEDDDDEEDQN